jgi:chorismate-pyruvate lyase
MSSAATSGGRGTVVDDAGVAHRFADTHFLLQREKSPDLAEVEIGALDPFLRGLLFTDGTVSRALEAHTLSRVTVTALEQVTAPAPAPASAYLRLEKHGECVRRRVTMHIGGERLAVWAESYIVLERLPSRFVATLGATPQGIGGSLQQLKLESARELLCFGLAPPPRWAHRRASRSTLTRVYRIITQGRPALLITEHFALEMRSGLYHLVGCADAAGC